MGRITAAQSRATAHLATTSTPATTTGDYGNCRACGKALQVHEFNLCTDCASSIHDKVQILCDNSEEWFAEHPVKPDLMDDATWRAYQEWQLEEFSTASACDRDAAF